LFVVCSEAARTIRRTHHKQDVPLSLFDSSAARTLRRTHHKKDVLCLLFASLADKTIRRTHRKKDVLCVLFESEPAIIRMTHHKKDVLCLLCVSNAARTIRRTQHKKDVLCSLFDSEGARTIRGTHHKKEVLCLPCLVFDSHATGKLREEPARTVRPTQKSRTKRVTLNKNQGSVPTLPLLSSKEKETRQHISHHSSSSSNPFLPVSFKNYFRYVIEQSAIPFFMH
jgi:hypothetical protein